MINTHSAIYNILIDDSAVVDLGASQGRLSGQLIKKVNCFLHQIEENRSGEYFQVHLNSHLKLNFYKLLLL